MVSNFSLGLLFPSCHLLLFSEAKRRNLISCRSSQSCAARGGTAGLRGWGMPSPKNATTFRFFAGKMKPVFKFWKMQRFRVVVVDTKITTFVRFLISTPHKIPKSLVFLLQLCCNQPQDLKVLFRSRKRSHTIPHDFWTSERVGVLECLSW